LHSHVNKLLAPRACNGPLASVKACQGRRHCYCFTAAGVAPISFED
jgi:hypothetical protein